MVASYSWVYFILALYPGDLLISLQVNRSKSIGLRAQQIWITMQIHIFWKKHTTDIIYIRRVQGCTFPNRLLRKGKYLDMYRCNLIYNGIGGGRNNYIWKRLMVWKQYGEIFNKLQSMPSFYHTNM